MEMIENRQNTADCSVFLIAKSLLMAKNRKSHGAIEQRRNFRNPTFTHQTPVQYR